MRKRVFISGPICKGDLAHNINQATAAFVALARAGFAPHCPHWSCFSGGAVVSPGGSVYALADVLGCGLPHADWLAIDLEWVEVSAALLRLPGESAGADLEVIHARAHGVPVFHSAGDLVAYFEANAKGTVPA